MHRCVSVSITHRISVSNDTDRCPTRRWKGSSSRLPAQDSTYSSIIIHAVHICRCLVFLSFSPWLPFWYPLLGRSQSKTMVNGRGRRPSILHVRIGQRYSRPTINRRRSTIPCGLFSNTSLIVVSVRKPSLGGRLLLNMQQVWILHGR